MLQLLNQSIPETTPTISRSKSERDYWTQLQLAIGDSQHFLDLIKNLKWEEEGLTQEAVDLIESKLATSHNMATTSREMTDSDGGGGVATTPSGGVVSSTVTPPSSLITVSMARYASESVSMMCELAVAIVDYHYSLGHHRAALNRVDKLKNDIESKCIYVYFTCTCTRITCMSIVLNE